MNYAKMPFRKASRTTRTVVYPNSRRSANRDKINYLVQSAVIILVALVLLLGFFSLFFLYDVSTSPVTVATETAQSSSSSEIGSQHKAAANPTSPSSLSVSSGPSCKLRQYPPHRFYHLAMPRSKQPDFLTKETEYIYGSWPVLLPTRAPQPAKLCVDQSSWLDTASEEKSTEKTTTTTLPFADGTNPSILTMARIQRFAPAVYEELLRHIARSTTSASSGSTPTYLATACMTNSQCAWNANGTEDTTQKPATIRTVLLVLDQHFSVLQQSTIYLERDAPWGRRLRKPQAEDGGSDWSHHMPALDDARLFVFDHKVWVSFREGKGFGYEAQVLNPIHFSWKAVVTDEHDATVSRPVQQLETLILASETTTFCCGRNMALLVPPLSNGALLSLTWVDPVTVIEVDTTPLVKRKQAQKNVKRRWRRLLEDVPLAKHRGANKEARQTVSSSSSLEFLRRNELEPRSDSEVELDINPKQSHRRLKEKNKPHKSHIHGTNAFMVPIPVTDIQDPTGTTTATPDAAVLYLGIAHFHRPNDRNANLFARFGHHYTHAFYTVAPRVSSSTATDSSLEYDLNGLSAEFVLPAPYDAADAEIIQFLSGLEYDETHRELIIAYGINDCEAAVTKVALTTVLNVLQPVSAGKQVVDFMEPLR